MKHIDLHDLGRYSDVLLSRSGEVRSRLSTRIISSGVTPFAVSAEMKAPADVPT